MKKHIPNIITLLNLFAGIIAVMLAVSDRLIEAAFFVLIGIFFDFFDGLVARLLKVQTELGKQLDSLADMVTSGVVPGIIMFQLFMKSSHKDWMNGLSCEIGNWMVFEETASMTWTGTEIHLLPLVGLLLTLAAAYRLANFNIDERQTSSFIGLPTPAMTLFILSLPLILAYSDNEFIKNLILNKYVLITITLIFSILMNVEIPLFSLKFKNFSFKNNVIEIFFLLASIILLIVLKFVAIPIIILLFVLLSVIKNLINTK
ncbi:MAG: CDP-alcohol phosphatidyltransferase family protein [Flavobacteriaceae bacterium]|nr:CDP-alcohol phosphatidyltransferase family protein [Flavobacteriaceae bacterium]